MKNNHMSQNTANINTNQQSKILRETSIQIVNGLYQKGFASSIYYSEAIVIETEEHLILFGHGSKDTKQYSIGDISLSTIKNLAEDKEYVALISCYSSTVDLTNRQLLTFNGEVKFRIAIQALSSFLDLELNTHRYRIDFALPIPGPIGLDPGGGGGGGDLPDPLPEIMPMFYYINAQATIDGITYSFNLKTYFGLDCYYQFLNDHLDFVRVSFLAKGYLTHYETEYLYGGLIYTETAITEHKVIQYTMDVSTEIVSVYDYDEEGNPIGYHGEEHTLVTTLGHKINGDPISLVHTEDLNELAEDEDLQNDDRLGEIGDLLTDLAFITLSISMGSLATFVAASAVAVVAGSASTIFCVWRGADITFQAVMIITARAALWAFGISLLICILLVVAALIVRAIAIAN
ncbi:MAG: hypothetical protein H7647_06745 [Candidatus Heimdallarchaeota archaeon]|nr:hypothetical protein [Candidatus Heimdallarchaeota archaeon]MCK4254124.1 hypothetical protein [Candidatus Heimdallarchaeota archaeon]